MKHLTRIACVVVALAVAQAQAASRLSKDQPIELVADTLEVLQAENKAVFGGNVIATQGNVHMRSDRMVVRYRSSGGPGEAADADAMGKGIYRLEASGNVVFTSPEENARGAEAVYDVDADTITLEGGVLLTRGKNVLKGTRLVYNLKTGRSVLTGGVAAGGGGRVRGLFVPGQGEQK